MAIVSVLILTHNAPHYVEETINTLNEVTDPIDLNKIEIIVWDNGSDKETIDVLKKLHEKKYIHKIYYSKDNLFFAGGNNRCAELADKNTKYYLLLNSDVKIINKRWLSYLLYNIDNEQIAVVSYGICTNPNRVDGYCYMIKKELYDKYPLDEDFQWYWSITQQQSHLLKEGYDILGFYGHENQIIHWGGASCIDFTKIKNNYVDIKEILRWYEFDGAGSVYFKIAPENNLLIYRLKNILKRIKNLINVKRD